MEEINKPKWYTEHPSGTECIEITEHMNFCLGNAIKYIWRAGLKTNDPLKDLAKAKWYIEREIKRLENTEENIDAEYNETISRVFGDGWKAPNTTRAEVGVSSLPSAAAGCVDSLGRTGNEPINMDALVQKSPMTDSLYRRGDIFRAQDELEAVREEAIKKACYTSMLPPKKPNESSPAAPAAKERSDGWIKHSGGAAPVFKGKVEVYIRDSTGWESPDAASPWEWMGWKYNPTYCITHYKIKEKN